MAPDNRSRKRRYNESRRADPSRSDAFYWSPAWRRLRAVFLAEHPLCADCQKRGRVVAAQVVDHKVPIRQGGAPLDPENLQALCATCHNSHKQSQDRGGKPRIGCGEDGIPIDPNHLWNKNNK